MRLFIGLDVSLARAAICVVGEHGKIVREAEVASDPEPLLAWLQTLDGNIAAMDLEAGPLSQSLHRGLTDAGLDAPKFDKIGSILGRIFGPQHIVSMS